MTGFVLLALGAVMLVAGWMAWTGRWRRWASWNGPPSWDGPLSVLPAMGLLLAGFALESFGAGPAFGGVALILLLVAFGLYFTSPRWFGPRWYREERDRHVVRLGNPMAAEAVSATIEGPDGGRAGVLRSRTVAQWKATHLDGDHAVPGYLALYRGAVAFGAQPGEQDTMVTVVRASDFRSAEPDGDGTLVVHASSRRTLRFQVRSPERKAQRITRTLAAARDAQHVAAVRR